MGALTHMMEHSGGMVSAENGGTGLLQLQSPLRQPDCAGRSFVYLAPVPSGKRYMTTAIAAGSVGRTPTSPAATGVWRRQR
ncbi:hypothetical protein [Mycolicibacterium llatzerense]|uniref:hypothetical protein n=1 Tax=Mycolicibacterium llatzerense TaxID=280871 RepID=UPI0013A6A925|nr:hypothetical protein [Mycolicibacterium llatzerense]